MHGGSVARPLRVEPFHAMNFVVFGLQLYKTRKSRKDRAKLATNFIVRYKFHSNHQPPTRYNNSHSTKMIALLGHLSFYIYCFI